MTAIRPVSPAPRTPLRCPDCQRHYSSFDLDMNIPDEQWLAINHGSVGGVLCPSCMVTRLSRLTGAVSVRAHLETYPAPAVSPAPPEPEPGSIMRVPCSRCNGSGAIFDTDDVEHNCYDCDGKGSLPVPASASVSPAPEGTTRERIIQAGTNWCQHTHGHGSDKASLAAAREILIVAKERTTSTVAGDDFRVISADEIDQLLAEIGGK